MVIYATFKGFKNIKYLSSKFKWIKVKSEIGDSLEGLYLSNNDFIFGTVTLKFGNRYRLTCNEIEGFNIISITGIKQVNKNPRCDIFRRFKDEFHIIGGKYKGKKDSEINKLKLSQYCIWLARHSTNEVTVTNSLSLLEKWL